MAIGAALVFFFFPKHDEERRLLAGYQPGGGTATSGEAGEAEPAPRHPTMA